MRFQYPRNPQQIQSNPRGREGYFYQRSQAMGITGQSPSLTTKKWRYFKNYRSQFRRIWPGTYYLFKRFKLCGSRSRSSGSAYWKISRNLDENRENRALIGRYLNRVSLDAGRDGSVIVMGTTAKETVAALAGWLLSSKGQSVAIAPASAVLLGK